MDRVVAAMALAILLLSVAGAKEAAAGQPPVITVGGGGWNQTIDSSNLTAGAGSDLTPTYSSAGTTLDINATPNPSPWTIRVSRDSAAWNSNLQLSVKLTGVGSGQKSSVTTPVGSTTLVTTAATTFISGKGYTTGMAWNYILGNVSVSIPPGTYTTTVTFTATSP